MGPPGGGLFGFKFSSRRHPRKFGLKRFLAVRRSGAKMGWPVLGYLLGKNFRRRDRDHLTTKATGGRRCAFCAPSGFSPHRAGSDRVLSCRPRFTTTAIGIWFIPTKMSRTLTVQGRWHVRRFLRNAGFFDLLRQEERREQANIPENLSERGDPRRRWHARHSGGLAARRSAGTTPRAARRPRQLRSNLDHRLYSTQCRTPGVGHAVWRGQQITAATANGGIGERLIGRPYLDFPAARRTQIP